MIRCILLITALLPLCALSAKQSQCVQGGCSGQLCVDAAQSDMASTCEWKPAYGCYQQHGICEAQPDGNCDWTPTEALKQCLDNADTVDGAAPQ